MHEGIVAHADVRRGLRAAQPAGAFSSGAKTASRQTYQEIIAGTGGADAETLDRWRYAVRVGIRGDLVEDWFYGLRLDTGTNPRSSWVTFGNNSASSTNTAGGLAPYGKGGDGIFFGQAYLGWRATPWLTLQGGKMPNPVYTTPMVWDPDINPEGIAERINYAVNDQLTLFGNFGQYVYQSFSPNSTGGNLGFANHDGYQFAWQGGVGYKFAEATSAKVAFSWYNYTGFASPEPFYTNQNPNGFFGPFANGAQNTTPATLPNGLRFNNGVNNLSYFEIPWEVNFPVGTGGLLGRAFGDVAYNTQADQRAAKRTYGSLGSQGLAWQLGLSVGTNMGLTMNQVAATKNSWEARAHWQQVDLNALDPNLIDSDFFEGRTNIQGLFLAFAYSPTDAIITTIRFGEAYRINQDGPTPGSNPDIPLVQPLSSYRLLQLDLTWKF
jgi:putative porin